MAGKKQPLAVIQANGRKHLTKAEIELRKAQELHPAADKVAPPDWLDKKQRKRFLELAAPLIDLEIMTNLDCEALARLVKAEADYVAMIRTIDQMPLTLEEKHYQIGPDGKPEIDQATGEKIVLTKIVVNDARAALLQQQDKLWKQCRQGATDFGLTIAGRCRLVAPAKKDDKPENRFLKYAKGKVEA